MALATATGAEATAQEAASAANAALMTADAAMEVAARTSCCEHCDVHGARLESLEEGRGAELEAALVADGEPLDAPAPGPKPKKTAAPAPDKPARKPFWPV
jgi:hypothetical protein